jgi:hypothetical protein
MDKQQQIEERLWDFIDGLSTPEENSAVEKLLQTDPLWQTKYRELLEVHQLFQSTELDQPSMRFTRNLMEEISKYKVAPATRSYVNKKIIFGIAGFFILVIVGFLTYAFFQINWSTEGSSSLPVDFSKVNMDWSKYFSSTFINIFLMIDVVIGLMLLDRYLRRKKQKAVTH